MGLSCLLEESSQTLFVQMRKVALVECLGNKGQYGRTSNRILCAICVLKLKKFAAENPVKAFYCIRTSTSYSSGDSPRIF